MKHIAISATLAVLVMACASERPNFTNRMTQGGASYLGQAAGQPVGWQPWGREAFALAARLDRPVLLSIGATDCEWCARMDRESYANPGLGELIDSLFVPVRVDRDERPDLARRYQTTLRSLAGLGGYPVTMFLTPDGSGFFGGTYFPPDDPVTGRGLRQLLPEVAKTYRDQRETITRHAALVRQLAVARATVSFGVLRAEVVETEVAALKSDLQDAMRAPGELATFARGQAIGFLLREFERGGDSASLRLAIEALDLLVDSLEAARPRSREALAQVARAQLARNLAAAWRLTADVRFGEAGRSLIRGLTLGSPAERPWFADRDAYVISSLIEAGQALGDSMAASAARAALEILLGRAYARGVGVRHTLGGSEVKLLQDQVQVAASCLTAYEAFDEPRYLEVAQDLASVLARDFADPLGGYFDAAEPEPAAPGLSDRTKQVFDDLLPGANALAARVLLKLADVTREASYEARGEATMGAFAGAVRGDGPRAATYLTAAREALARH